MSSHNNIVLRNDSISWWDKENCEHLITIKDGFAIEMTFKPEPEKGLRPEESQLLEAYIGKILREIEHEEKLIIEAEKKAPKRKTKQHIRFKPRTASWWMIQPPRSRSSSR